MRLTSTMFENGGLIPEAYTCDDRNVNPPLTIVEVPEGTVSLALIMDDPDVPKNLLPEGVFDHWVVFNIPPTVREIAEDTPPEGVLGVGTRGDLGYRGPCPPDREHRYFFKLYALDVTLGLSLGSTKAEVERAMAGHIIEQAELMGRYDRARR